MLKRGILFLFILLLFIQISFAQQENQCALEPTPQILWDIYSKIPAYAGDNERIIQAALKGWDVWTNNNPRRATKTRVEIESGLRRIAERAGSCIDDYSLNSKDDCWNQDALCKENKCVKFEDMGWSEEILDYVKYMKERGLENIEYIDIRGLPISSSEELKPIIHILFRLLNDNTNKEVKIIVFNSLGKIGSPEAVQSLIKVLESDQDWAIRSIIIGILGKIGSPEAVPALIRALENDQETFVRSNAAKALREIDSPEILSTFRRVISEETHIFVIYEITEFLVEKGDYGLVAVNVANKINEESRPYNYENFAVLINRLHDLESRPQDQVRTEIIQNLNTNSLYHLIAIGGADLYTSTFLKMYQKLCNNPPSENRRCQDSSFIDEIDSIDPEGKYKTDFFLRLSNFNRLNEVISGRENFFNNILLDSLTREDNKEVLRNSVLLTSTIQNIFTNPSLSQYKPFLENLLIDNYNQAISNKDKLREGIFAYFIKLSSNNFENRREEAIRIASTLPEVQIPEVPSEFLSDNKVSAKLYFYTDEDWWRITIDWLEQDEFRKQQVNENTFVLTKTESGRILEITVTTDNSDVEESINNPNMDIIGHRGHSYHLTGDTFTSDISSNANKLLYLGSCGSFGSVSELQKQFPNAYFISDEDTGRGSDNHRILLGIMRNIAQGERNWETIKQNTYQRLSEEPQGIIWPSEKSLLLYNFIQRLTGTSMDILLRNQYGYIPQELFPTPDRCTIQTVPFGETIS